MNREQGLFTNANAAHRSANRLAEMVERYDCALTVKELADILKCSKGQVYKLIDEKRIPALKVGTMIRLDPGAVAEWIRGRMTIAA